jgi:hypothetical protein
MTSTRTGFASVLEQQLSEIYLKGGDFERYQVSDWDDWLQSVPGNPEQVFVITIITTTITITITTINISHSLPGTILPTPHG